MFIGNDIVNLNAALLLQKHLNFKWVNKIFNTSEQAYIAKASDPERMLWLLWSCKESAYKVLVKLKQRRFMNFIPIQLSEPNRKEGSVQVKYGEESLTVFYKVTTHFIFTHCLVGGLAEREVIHEVLHLENYVQEAGSDYIRTSIKTFLTQKHPGLKVKFVKDHLFVPQVLTSDNQLQFDLSLSHDEPYFAYSIGQLKASNPTDVIQLP